VPVTVWSADTGQVDEPLESAFLDRMAALGVPLIRHDLRPGLGKIGLEIARAQARLRNGYWNTTGALRVVLVTACAAWQRDTGFDEADTGLAHGCVGLGNDQRRFNRLFQALRSAQTVQNCLADWSAAGETLSRASMAQALTDWTGLPRHAVYPRALWSSDGSILGVSHEGTLVEDHRSDWTQTPFAMTHDPLSDGFAEDVTLRFRAGQLVSVGDRSGGPEQLLAEANRLAGAHGLGRIGVMEDRLKGTKCRGIYEAPGLTLLGHAWGALQELCLSAQELAQFDALSAGIAADIYCGNWHATEARDRRQRMEALCGPLSGAVLLTLRGGHVIMRRVEAEAAGIERRFASGGIAWAETPALAE
jgi:argininosuccinate synthase